jgi:crotonobetainyl-CoA:carnitine CoA-transferase CaiB-like acyl-CoA transferase
VRSADAVFSNLRGDLPPRLGLTYASLADVNPRVVCCSLSGFGMTGPRAAEPAYDYLLQGLAGWMSICGDPAGPPTKTGLSLVDMIGGTVAGLALLAGVHQARRTGRGCDCDVSLHEAALSFLNYVGTWHLSAGYRPERLPMSAHPSIVPFQIFPAADGWIVVACAKEKFWRALCASVDRADLAEDPWLATVADRFAHREELVAELEGILRGGRVEEWLERLGKAGVPVSPVLDVEDAFLDPQVEAREVVASYPHPRFGVVRTMRGAARVGEERPPLAPAPGRGQHTDGVLGGLLGYPPERIAALRASGALG